MAEKNISREEELKDLLRRLRENREKVPAELLETKYKVPYEQLKDNIVKEATALFKEIVLHDLKYFEILPGAIIVNIFEGIYKAEDCKHKLGQILFKEYNLEALISAAESFRALFIKELGSYVEALETITAEMAAEKKNGEEATAE